MTVKELSSRMDSRELSEWIAYDRLYPLPDGHYSAAVVASTLANCFSSKRFTVDDFIPTKQVDKPQTALEQKHIMDSLVAMSKQATI